MIIYFFLNALFSLMSLLSWPIDLIVNCENLRQNWDQTCTLTFVWEKKIVSYIKPISNIVFPLDTLLFKSYVGSNWNTSCTTTQRYWFSDAGPYCSDKSVFLVSNWFSQKKKHATLSNGWANVDLWLSQVIIVSVS